MQAEAIQESAMRNKRITDEKRRQNEEDAEYRRRLDEMANLGEDADAMARSQKKAYAEDLKRQINEKNARKDRGVDVVPDYSAENEAYE